MPNAAAQQPAAAAPAAGPGGPAEAPAPLPGAAPAAPAAPAVPAAEPAAARAAPATTVPPPAAPAAPPPPHPQPPPAQQPAAPPAGGLPPQPPLDTAAAEARGFVTRRGTQLVWDGKPFYFVGMNAYWFIDFYDLDWGRVRVEEALDAAQRLGISVIRIWAFNRGLPKSRFTYNTRELAGLDWLIYSAKRRGIHMMLTLGNLWAAYKGPEEFLLQATGSAVSQDVLSFYGNQHARALFKHHIWTLVTRVNPFTGLAYKDEPAIFGWSLFNEPRCPGCNEPQQQAVHQDWLQEMARFLRRVDPLHLVAAATEGFFVKNDTTNFHQYNPGAGTQCDGEDWLSISAMPEFDLTTVHVYERHLELRPEPTMGRGDWPNWVHCNFKCYVEWFKVYMDLHIRLSAEPLGKPLVLEEFGLTWWKATLEDQKLLFKLVFDWLERQRTEGGPMAGAMFWNGAHNDTSDVDGYNIQIDRPAFTRPGSRLAPPPAAWLAAPLLEPAAAAGLVARLTVKEPGPGVVLPPDDIIYPPDALPADLGDLAAALRALPPPPPPLPLEAWEHPPTVVVALADGTVAAAGSAVLPAAPGFAVPVAPLAAAAPAAAAPAVAAPAAAAAPAGPAAAASAALPTVATPPAPAAAAAPAPAGAPAAPAAAVVPAAAAAAVPATPAAVPPVVPAGGAAPPAAAKPAATASTAPAATPAPPAAAAVPAAPAAVPPAAPAVPPAASPAGPSAPTPVGAPAPAAANPAAPAIPAPAPAAAAAAQPPAALSLARAIESAAAAAPAAAAAALGTAPVPPAVSGRRRLRVVEDELDGFSGEAAAASARGCQPRAHG
ncbi:mannan endo-1,4-beta-mannosidase [Raphidocelis subcapitata]|uniref:mannan endo-1,4-beta-mannosidase n=1 Tax=Raphidocelis subcapitata TaxID=307507 RepID=A0A2V0NMV9_9CHLO|nr:mannan endo-1,4-beta-mannosidase [Raphidocelis subcapitata]|eukprot:GBF87772.1 mannan endo-1,4-beta-mannosidase [Raphidocelis subcapitata]